MLNARERVLGRGRKKYKANIPRNLLYHEHDSRFDVPEIKRCRAYKPKWNPVARDKQHAYVPQLTKTSTEDAVRAKSRIFIEEISGILTDENAFVLKRVHFSGLEREPEYPGSAPTHPDPIPEPPCIDLRFTDPIYDPPYWSKPLTFLNRFVDETYANERSKVYWASTRKESFMELIAEKKEAYERACREQKADFEYAISEFERFKEEYLRAFRKDTDLYWDLLRQTSKPGKEGLMSRIDFGIEHAFLPSYLPHEHSISFNEESGVLVYDHRFPDVGRIEWLTRVNHRVKAANKIETKNAIDRLYSSLCIRLAFEIIKHDDQNNISAIGINGWAEYIDKRNGHFFRAYCVSLFATREQITSLNLSAIDPIVAFKALKGHFVPSLELTPIRPLIRQETNDSRFIQEKDVLGTANRSQNLATMDWGDFEHLCRELFELAFADRGATVKVTQASRDRGIDAIVFDPDPLKGGKTVIQAKRYSNTVDVSAVRDLYGAVINEGANKGVLVTTSQFGAESYSFAKDKPITLFNGSELLGLLEVHGYRFRIDLSEAKSMSKL